MYTLTVTEEQLRVICQATELYARLHIPQYDGLKYLVWDRLEGDGLEEFRECCNRMEALAGNRGLRGGVESTAWDLYQVTRYRLAHDRLKPGEQPGITVDFYEPRLTGPEPLATVERP
jgi:hypothetical protein